MRTHDKAGSRTSRRRHALLLRGLPGRPRHQGGDRPDGTRRDHAVHVPRIGRVGRGDRRFRPRVVHQGHARQTDVVGYTTRNSGGVPDNFKNWFVVRFDRKFAISRFTTEQSPSEATQLVGNHALVRVGVRNPPRRAGHGTRSIVVHLADAGRAKPRGTGKRRFRNRKVQGAGALGRGAGTHRGRRRNHGPVPHILFVPLPFDLVSPQILRN